MPPIEASFKPEEEVDGEPAGPLILSDSDDAEFHEELEAMPRSDAKMLAELNGWLFSER